MNSNKYYLIIPKNFIFSQAAQTNSRLLHVLSDLVKTFLDIEHDINTHLLEYGLVPSRTGTLNHHDDDTGNELFGILKQYHLNGF